MAPTNAAPNLLVIVTDEERERCGFPASVRFPNRDRIAARGVSFTAHHAQAFPCTPSRATMFTGVHAGVTGMRDNVDFRWQPAMSPSVPTLGHVLRGVGYKTAYKGKWHLGLDPDRPRSLDGFGFGYWDGTDMHGLPYEGWLRDGATAASAADWLADHGAGTEPWCLVVSFVNPHDIMLYPRFRKPFVRDWGVDTPGGDSLSTKPSVQKRWARACDATSGRVWLPRTWRMILNAYVDLHDMVDVHIGTVVDALAVSGAEDRTVVVFTSDHGDMAGSHGLRQKGAMLYRENVNVPLTVVWPRVTPPGSRCAVPTAATDLVPTLCSIAQAPVPDLPGRDLTPLLRDPMGPGVGRRDGVLVVSESRSSMGLPRPPLVCDDPRGFLRGVVTSRFKFGRYFTPGRWDRRDLHDVELYDLDSDPSELTNRALDPAMRGVRDDLDALLAELVRTEL
ncbi:MAG: sulfatase-like hydrolase/transferase [Acidimicrobiia bacterium]